MLGKAISIASQAFENKKDKGGKPYILHCLWVMNNVRHLGDNAMCAAIMHDLIEDCEDWTLEKLRGLGFCDEVVESVNLLTHPKGMSYEEYIKRLSSGKYKLPIAIKLKDLEHNMKPSRLKGLTKKDHDRMDKYMRWYTYLKEI